MGTLGFFDILDIDIPSHPAMYYTPMPHPHTEYFSRQLCNVLMSRLVPRTDHSPLTMADRACIDVPAINTRAVIFISLISANNE